MNVKKAGGLSHVFVGKESYSPSQWIFILEGALPPYLPKRIMGFHEAGLWECWAGLVDIRAATIGDARGDGRAARVDGNVVVIFVVWSYGMVLSIEEMMLGF